MEEAALVKGLEFLVQGMLSSFRIQNLPLSNLSPCLNLMDHKKMMKLFIFTLLLTLMMMSGGFRHQMSTMNKE